MLMGEAKTVNIILMMKCLEKQLLRRVWQTRILKEYMLVMLTVLRWLRIKSDGRCSCYWSYYQAATAVTAAATNKFLLCN